MVKDSDTRIRNTSINLPTIQTRKGKPNMAFTENQVEDSVSNMHTRRQFMKGATMAGAAALIAAGSTRTAFAKVSTDHIPLTNDAEILNFALLLEHIEAEFYKMAVDSGNLDEASLAILTDVRDHEVAHVEALHAAVMAEVEKGNIEEDAVFTVDAVNTDAFDVSSQAAILELANAFEPVGTAAYTVAAPFIQEVAYLAVAGSIQQLEARHMGAVRWLVDLNPSPEGGEFALGPVMTINEVEEAIAGFVNS